LQCAHGSLRIVHGRGLRDLSVQRLLHIPKAIFFVEQMTRGNEQGLDRGESWKMSKKRRVVRNRGSTC
jgi:hypothetical protein